MSFLKLSLASILACTLLSCNHEKPEPTWSELPGVTSLDSLLQTDFMPTLENTVNADKNSIYAPTLLYAWDAIRNELGTGIIIGPGGSEDFLMLNGSRSFANALDAGDYTIDKEIEGGRISVSTFFNKTLPFPAKMDKLNEGISFDGAKVAAFGMKHMNQEIVDFSEILYYRSDDEFALKFTPEDKDNEIILVKGFNTLKNLSEAVTIINELTESGKRENRDSTLAWKYAFNREDIFSIPVIKFNIKTNYKTLEGQRFATPSKDYFIAKAFQRTGFILNETGAVVESEAEIVVCEASAPPPDDPVKPHPKHMIFDKPFFIIVKKKDRANPYFVMKVENTELMERK
jgi:hypothetical protein